MRIGDKVKINYPGTLVDGREGKLVGKRGDQRPGVPYWMVFDYTSNIAYPIPQDKLEII